jgi:excinuclease UvrABC nuclease subunit
LTALPQTSGIYLVLNQEDTVVYVGQSQNIYQRWNGGHHKLAQLLARYGTNLYIRWVELPLWLLNRAENAAVDFYQPEFNQKQPPVV